MSQLSLFKGKRQRGIKPPSPKEFNLHCMVADTLRRWATPGWRWSHFPSGEKRHVVTAVRLKRMGVQPGWPDFILFAPYGRGPLFLELKRKGHKLSEEQHDFGAWAIEHHYPYRFTDDFKEAIEILKVWGAVRASVSA